MLEQYFAIIVKDNYLAEVSKIDEDTYNYFDYTFDFVYHTQKGLSFKMDEDMDAGIGLLIVDGNHLYELLDDLKAEGFCYDDNLGGD